ncbi:hypothetical protein [Agromyces mangrovi Wang et al. 2018]|uniref:hypothetical protein n=1 Tax=Agromyces mangrovi TaxID=1858653 RepID=UPI0025746638|nr:hypothetical protein [Agromyces mangrovi]BDZ63485.1 hypothetical protein GCM10025877_04230 [Agromyces mangrovi]
MDRTRTAWAILAGAATISALSACAPAEPTEARGPQAIVGWSNGGDELIILIGTCHGDPEATVVEDDETVTVTIESTLHDPGDACQDSLRVALDTQLGDRAVIDGVTGKTPPGIEG